MSLRAFVSRLVLAVVVSGVVLAGQVAGAATRAAPKQGGTLTWLFNSEPPNMDPAQLREVPQISPVAVQVAIFDQLLYTDPVTLKIKPKIATSITTSDKGLSWVMKLRSGVKFSDGTPFDAAAVQYNWQRIADPATRSGFAIIPQAIATYETPDPLTLKVTLKTADPLFDQTVARALSSIGSPTALKASATAFQTKPVAAGPFLLKEWVRGITTSLVRNPGYWQKGKPYLDAIEIKVVNDDTARLSTMQSGGAHVALDGATVNINAYKSDAKRFSVVNTPALGGGYAVGFNLTKPPFNDARFRQALSLIWDSEELVNRASFGDKTTVMTTIDEKQSPYYNAKLKLPKPDPAAAQKLIDAIVTEQGGKPIEWTHLAFNVPNHMRMAEALQALVTSKLKNVTMKVEFQAPATAVPRLATGDYQSFLLSSSKWTDPALDLPSTLKTGAASNFMKYSSPAVDAAITQIATTDPKAKQQAHETIIENVLKDLPFVFIARFQTFYAYDKTLVKNWKMFYDLRPLIEDVSMAKPKS